MDEADSLTTDAQTALRRTIEQYSRSTRFCIICNYVSRIIDPITSRCAKFRFGAVETGAAVQRLQMIAENEGVIGAQDANALTALIECSDGDLRRAITLLQGIHRLKRPLSLEVVNSLSGSLPASVINSAIELCTAPTANPSQLTHFVETLLRDAHSPAQFLHQLQAHLLADSGKLSRNALALLMARLAECESRIGEGADESIQVLQVLTELRSLLHPNESVLYRSGHVIL